MLLLVVATSLCVLVVLDANMVALSLPSISRSFHSEFDQLEWVISSYVITFASCLLPAGALADRYGRRRVLLAGLLIFCIASLGCGFATSDSILNVARAAQGVGAALQLTSALAIIGNSFTDSTVAARAWALWGTCIGLTTCAAPVIRGVFTDLLGWRSIFLINASIAMAVGILGAVLAQRTHVLFGRLLQGADAPGHSIPKAFVDRVLAGDVTHAASLVPGQIFPEALQAARAASASGFATALIVAACVSSITGALIALMTRRKGSRRPLRLSAPRVQPVWTVAWNIRRSAPSTLSLRLPVSIEVCAAPATPWQPRVAKCRRCRPINH